MSACCPEVHTGFLDELPEVGDLAGSPCEAVGVVRGGQVVNRHREFGEAGLLDRPSVPHHQPTAIRAEVVAHLERLRRDHEHSARRITHELAAGGVVVSVRTVSRLLAHLGLHRRRFLDPTGENNCRSRRIQARRPGHMVHLDVKKVGVIPGFSRLAYTEALPDEKARTAIGRGARPPLSVCRGHLSSCPSSSAGREPV
jgi:hypothetical protein